MHSAKHKKGEIGIIFTIAGLVFLAASAIITSIVSQNSNLKLTQKSKASEASGCSNGSWRTECITPEQKCADDAAAENVFLCEGGQWVFKYPQCAKRCLASSSSAPPSQKQCQTPGAILNNCIRKDCDGNINKMVCIEQYCDNNYQIQEKPGRVQEDCGKEQSKCNVGQTINQCARQECDKNLGYYVCVETYWDSTCQSKERTGSKTGTRCTEEQQAITGVPTMVWPTITPSYSSDSVVVITEPTKVPEPISSVGSGTMMCLEKGIFSYEGACYECTGPDVAVIKLPDNSKCIQSGDVCYYTSFKECEVTGDCELPNKCQPVSGKANCYQCMTPQGYDYFNPPSYVNEEKTKCYYWSHDECAYSGTCDYPNTCKSVPGKANCFQCITPQGYNYLNLPPGTLTCKEKGPALHEGKCYECSAPKAVAVPKEDSYCQQEAKVTCYKSIMDCKLSGCLSINCVALPLNAGCVVCNTNDPAEKKIIQGLIKEEGDAINEARAQAEKVKQEDAKAHANCVWTCEEKGFGKCVKTIEGKYSCIRIDTSYNQSQMRQTVISGDYQEYQTSETCGTAGDSCCVDTNKRDPDYPGDVPLRYCNSGLKCNKKTSKCEGDANYKPTAQEQIAVTKSVCGGLWDSCCTASQILAHPGETPQGFCNEGLKCINLINKCSPDDNYQKTQAVANYLGTLDNIDPTTIGNVISTNLGDDQKTFRSLPQQVAGACGVCDGKCIYSANDKKFICVAKSSIDQYYVATYEKGKVAGQGDINQPCHLLGGGPIGLAPKCNAESLECGSDNMCHLKDGVEQVLAYEANNKKVEMDVAFNSLTSPHQLSIVKSLLPTPSITAVKPLALAVSPTPALSHLTDISVLASDDAWAALNDKELAKVGCLKSKDYYFHNGICWKCVNSSNEILSTVPIAFCTDATLKSSYPGKKCADNGGYCASKNVSYGNPCQKISDPSLADCPDEFTCCDIAATKVATNQPVLGESCGQKYGLYDISMVCASGLICHNGICQSEDDLAYDEDYQKGLGAGIDKIPVLGAVFQPLLTSVSPNYYNSATIRAQIADAQVKQISDLQESTTDQERYKELENDKEIVYAGLDNQARVSILRRDENRSWIEKAGLGTSGFTGVYMGNMNENRTVEYIDTKDRVDELVAKGKMTESEASTIKAGAAWKAASEVAYVAIDIGATIATVGGASTLTKTGTSIAGKEIVQEVAEQGARQIIKNEGLLKGVIKVGGAYVFKGAGTALKATGKGLVIADKAQGAAYVMYSPIDGSITIGGLALASKFGGKIISNVSDTAFGKSIKEGTSSLLHSTGLIRKSDDVLVKEFYDQATKELSLQGIVVRDADNLVRDKAYSLYKDAVSSDPRTTQALTRSGFDISVSKYQDSLAVATSRPVAVSTGEVARIRAASEDTGRVLSVNTRAPTRDELIVATAERLGGDRTQAIAQVKTVIDVQEMGKGWGISMDNNAVSAYSQVMETSRVGGQLTRQQAVDIVTTRGISDSRANYAVDVMQLEGVSIADTGLLTRAKNFVNELTQPKQTDIRTNNEFITTQKGVSRYVTSEENAGIRFNDDRFGVPALEVTNKDIEVRVNGEKVDVGASRELVAGDRVEVRRLNAPKEEFIYLRSESVDPIGYLEGQQKIIADDIYSGIETGKGVVAYQTAQTKAGVQFREIGQDRPEIRVVDSNVNVTVNGEKINYGISTPIESGSNVRISRPGLVDEEFIFQKLEPSGNAGVYNVVVDTVQKPQTLAERIRSVFVKEPATPATQKFSFWDNLTGKGKKLETTALAGLADTADDAAIRKALTDAGYPAGEMNDSVVSRMRGQLDTKKAAREAQEAAQKAVAQAPDAAKPKTEQAPAAAAQTKPIIRTESPKVISTDLEAEAQKVIKRQIAPVESDALVKINQVYDEIEEEYRIMSQKMGGTYIPMTAEERAAIVANALKQVEDQYGPRSLDSVTYSKKQGNLDAVLRHTDGTVSSIRLAPSSNVGQVIMPPKTSGKTVRLYRGVDEYTPDEIQIANFFRGNGRSEDLLSSDRIRRFLSDDKDSLADLLDELPADVRKDALESIAMTNMLDIKDFSIDRSGEIINRIRGMSRSDQLKLLADEHVAYQRGAVRGTSLFISATENPKEAFNFSSGAGGSRGVGYRGVMVLDVPEEHVVRIRDMTDKATSTGTEFGVVKEIQPEWVSGFVPAQVTMGEDVFQKALLDQEVGARMLAGDTDEALTRALRKKGYKDAEIKAALARLKDEGTAVVQQIPSQSTARVTSSRAKFSLMERATGKPASIERQVREALPRGSTIEMVRVKLNELNYASDGIETTARKLTDQLNNPKFTLRELLANKSLDLHYDVQALLDEGKTVAQIQAELAAKYPSEEIVSSARRIIDQKGGAYKALKTSSSAVNPKKSFTFGDRLKGEPGKLSRDVDGLMKTGKTQAEIVALLQDEYPVSEINKEWTRLQPKTKPVAKAAAPVQRAQPAPAKQALTKSAQVQKPKQSFTPGDILSGKPKQLKDEISYMTNQGKTEQEIRDALSAKYPAKEIDGKISIVKRERQLQAEKTVRATQAREARRLAASKSTIAKATTKTSSDVEQRVVADLDSQIQMMITKDYSNKTAAEVQREIEDGLQQRISAWLTDSGSGSGRSFIYDNAFSRLRQQGIEEVEAIRIADQIERDLVGGRGELVRQQLDRVTVKTTQNPDRVAIAVGDVHGDFDSFVKLLSGQARDHESRVISVKLVDQQGKWIGGSNVIYQTGDLFDRAPQGKVSVTEARKMMILQKQARAAGGDVVITLGNHDIAAVAAAKHGQFGIIRPGPTPDEMRLLAADRELIDWVVNQPAIVKVGDTVYLHADTMNYFNYGGTIDDINANIRSILINGQATFIDDYGNRVTKTVGDLAGELTDRDRFTSQNVDVILNTFDARRIVHGHSREAAVRDSRVINVDWGLSAGYNSAQNKGAFHTDLTPGGVENAVSLRPMQIGGTNTGLNSVGQRFLRNLRGQQ